jgi:hypothetical protein
MKTTINPDQKILKVVLNTELVVINELEHEYQILIRMSQGGTLEHEPFPKSLEGLVTALQLATEICAGKFFPRRVVDINQNAPRIGRETLQIDQPRGRRG